MKKKIDEAAPAAVIDPEGGALTEEMELDPVGTKLDPERSELEPGPTGPLPAPLGKDGKPMSPETMKVFYDRFELSEEMKALGAAASIDEMTLRARAREFHSCYPDQWREMFLSDLVRWGQGEMPWEEKLRRRLVVSPERRLYELEERLQDLLPRRPEDRVVVLQEFVELLARRNEDTGIEGKRKKIALLENRLCADHGLKSLLEILDKHIAELESLGVKGAVEK